MYIVAVALRPRPLFGGVTFTMTSTRSPLRPGTLYMTTHLSSELCNYNYVSVNVHCILLVKKVDIPHDTLF